ncbi:MAG: phosphate/phosphite/phosphonate ABC transporter substrate-binding protein, partial [Candidatus Eremiobacteraeota bacterium]|nr:phosphate/phosphite/phosphonate ABC transporter substrate-binding protein [Candidatus Eremiobacteraeota bacterium]
AASIGAGTTVNVTMAADVPPQIAAVATQQRHIALLNPLGFIFARQQNPVVDVVALAERIGPDGKPGPTYRAQIYTSKKTGIRTIADVKGHSLGFGVPFSTSNFLVPAALLKAKHRLFSVSSIAFLGGHQIVAKAVYDGKVDVGAGHDGVLLDLAKAYGYGDAEDRMLRLCWTDPIPSDPVVVNIPDDAERGHVKDAVVAAGSDPDVIERSIAVFWGKATGLAATSAAEYEPLNGFLTSMSLGQDDLLG